MKVLRFHIHLAQPLLATTLDGEPNSSISANYIPGSLIRGLCIQNYLRENPNIQDLSGDPTSRRLFLDGDTRYLHAYLLSDNKQRTLPTPRSLFIPKSKTDYKVAHNASHEEWNKDKREEVEEEEGETLKPISKPFCIISDESIILYEPARSIKVHTQRDRKQGRSRKDQGAVFQYDALDQGQIFEGVILVDHDNDAEMINNLLSTGTAWLGRSRSAGYGKGTINQIRIEHRWREVQNRSLKEIEHAGKWTITFLSDALLYRAEGQPVTSLDNQTLSTYLGVPVEIDQEHTFSSVSMIGGFNRTWQLPIIQSYAISAGSIVSFTSNDLDKEKIQVLEQQGIGDRRVEGFGRIVFNWLGDTERFEVSERSLEYPKPVVANLDDGSMAQQLAKQMANRLLEAKIQQQMIQFLKNDVKDQGKIPTNSQLSRVRMIVRQSLPTGDVEKVKQDIAAFRPTARNVFEKARIEGQSLLVWMNTLLEQPGKVWEQLVIQDHDFPVVAGCKATRVPALDRKVTLQLLDTVLHQYTKLNNKERNEK